MRHRLLSSLVLVGCLCAQLVVLSSCLGAGASTTPLRIKESGAARSRELLVAYRTDDKPVSFLEDDKPAGLYVDLLDDLARRTGRRAVFVATDFASAVPSVRDHLYDTAAMTVLVTDERSVMVDFTTAVSYNSAAIVSRGDAPLPMVAAAADKTVAVTRGSALINLLNTRYPKIQVSEHPSISASLAAVESGSVDGMFTGLVTATQIQRDHPALAVSEPVVSARVAFPIALDRPPLLAALNDALRAAMLDGTYARLRAKWAPNEPVSPQLLQDYPGMPSSR